MLMVSAETSSSSLRWMKSLEMRAQHAPYTLNLTPQHENLFQHEVSPQSAFVVKISVYSLHRVLGNDDNAVNFLKCN